MSHRLAALETLPQPQQLLPGADVRSDEEQLPAVPLRLASLIDGAEVVVGVELGEGLLTQELQPRNLEHRLGEARDLAGDLQHEDRLGLQRVRRRTQAKLLGI